MIPYYSIAEVSDTIIMIIICTTMHRGGRGGGVIREFELGLT